VIYYFLLLNDASGEYGSGVPAHSLSFSLSDHLLLPSPLFVHPSFLPRVNSRITSWYKFSRLRLLDTNDRVTCPEKPAEVHSRCVNHAAEFLCLLFPVKNLEFINKITFCIILAILFTNNCYMIECIYNIF